MVKSQLGISNRSSRTNQRKYQEFLKLVLSKERVLGTGTPNL